MIGIDVYGKMNKSKFDHRKQHLRSIRLKNYDYRSEGAYYVTIVTYERECLFGEILDNEMHLSTYGEIVQKWWNELIIHFQNVETGAFIIMPNHIHGIIFITNERRGEVLSPHNRTNQNNKQDFNNTEISLKQGGETPPLPHRTLGQIVAYFKYKSTKEMNAVENTGTITKFWQRNYYEHVIRNENELKQKTDYIWDNPFRWDEDAENPLNL